MMSFDFKLFINLSAFYLSALCSKSIATPIQQENYYPAEILHEIAQRTDQPTWYHLLCTSKLMSHVTKEAIKNHLPVRISHRQQSNTFRQATWTSGVRHLRVVDLKTMVLPRESDHHEDFAPIQVVDLNQLLAHSPQLDRLDLEITLPLDQSFWNLLSAQTQLQYLTIDPEYIEDKHKRVTANIEAHGALLRLQQLKTINIKGAIDIAATIALSDLPNLSHMGLTHLTLDREIVKSVAKTTSTRSFSNLKSIAFLDNGQLFLGHLGNYQAVINSVKVLQTWAKRVCQNAFVRVNFSHRSRPVNLSWLKDVPHVSAELDMESDYADLGGKSLIEFAFSELNITSLTLSRIPCAAFDGDWVNHKLRAAQHLTHLNLEFDHYNNDPMTVAQTNNLIRVLGGLENLQSLSLTGIWPLTASLLGTLQTLSFGHLKSITIDRCWIENLSQTLPLIAMIPSIVKLTNLEPLECEEDFGNAMHYVLSERSTLPHLRVLRITPWMVEYGQGNPLNYLGAYLNTHPFVDTLELSFYNILFQPSEAMGTFPQIRHLIFNFEDYDDQDVYQSNFTEDCKILLKLFPFLQNITVHDKDDLVRHFKINCSYPGFSVPRKPRITFEHESESEDELPHVLQVIYLDSPLTDPNEAPTVPAIQAFQVIDPMEVDQVDPPATLVTNHPELEFQPNTEVTTEISNADDAMDIDDQNNPSSNHSDYAAPAPKRRKLNDDEFN